MLCRNHVRFIQASLTRTSSRAFSDSPRRGHDVAVLGGGITGLTSAFALAKENHQVTLYEAESQLGGWMQTKSFETENGPVLFEQGPRTMRRNGIDGLPTAQLLQELDLIPETVCVSSQHPGLRNRYIYYPDHLVQLPPHDNLWDTLYSVIREPLYRGLVDLRTAWSPPKASLADESVGQFIHRVTGKQGIAENLASAVLHGIYAGDVWKLSMKSVLTKISLMDSKIAHTEQQYTGIRGLLRLQAALSAAEKQLVTHRQYHTQEDMHHVKWDVQFLSNMLGCSMFYLRSGMEVFVRRLTQKLETMPNVTIKTSTPVQDIIYLGNADRMSVRMGSEQESEHDYVLSTIFAGNLGHIVAGKRGYNPLPMHAVSVATVNVYYPNEQIRPSWLQGFGYLIPQSVPIYQNPELALGVIFDSDATPASNGVQGTKMTVMLGGHYWDAFSGVPSEEDCKVMALSVLERHLGIKERPQVIHATVNRKCIPQYTVGHARRMAKAHSDLQSLFKGRLGVAGSSFNGVSVNDCINAGRLAPKRLGSTGLEPGADDELYEIVHEPLETTLFAGRKRTDME